MFKLYLHKYTNFCHDVEGLFYPIKKQLSYEVNFIIVSTLNFTFKTCRICPKKNFDHPRTHLGTIWKRKWYIIGIRILLIIYEALLFAKKM